MPAGGLVGQAAESFWADYAFWVTGEFDDAVLAEAKDAIAQAIRAGATTAELVTTLDTALGDYLPTRDAAGRIVNVPARIETIARTNVATAMGAGRQAAFEDPDLGDFVAGFAYSAVLDNRTRDNHAAWDGVVREPEFWSDTNRVPPNGFNCRCVLVPVTPYDQPEFTADDDLPRGDLNIPDPGFE